MSVYEGDTKLGPQTVAAVRATPADGQIVRDAMRQPLALLDAPQAAVDVSVRTGYLDVLFDVPDSVGGLALRDRAAAGAGSGMRAMTVVRLRAADGAVRAFEFQGDPGLVSSSIRAGTRRRGGS